MLRPKKPVHPVTSSLISLGDGNQLTPGDYALASQSRRAYRLP